MGGVSTFWSVVLIVQLRYLNQRRHQKVDIFSLVEVVTHTVGQGPDSVIKDEQILVLVD